MFKKIFIDEVETTYKIFLIIISIQIGILAFLNLEINDDYLFELNGLLITSTGIFSAIIIAALFNGITKYNQDQEKTKKAKADFSERLTKFRKVLYYLSISEKIWGEKFHKNYLTPLRKKYPAIDINTSKYDLKDKDDRYELIMDDRFGDRRTRLFLSILTIVDIKYGEELNLIESLNHTYNPNKLSYIHDSFNNIWYYLEHRRADVEFKYENVARILRDNFEKELLYFVKERNVKNFNDDILCEISNSFYQDHNKKHFVLASVSSEGLPTLYKQFFGELLILLIFGLILPLLNISSTQLFSGSYTKISLILVLLTFSYIVFHLKEIVFSKSDINLYKYTS